MTSHLFIFLVSQLDYVYNNNLFHHRKEGWEFFLMGIKDIGQKILQYELTE